MNGLLYVQCPEDNMSTRDRLHPRMAIGEDENGNRKRVKDDRRSAEDEEDITLEEKVRKMAELRGMRMLEGEPRWREAVRQKMETELSRRVREALETPPLERMQRRNQLARQQKDVSDLNAHLVLDLTERERDFLRTKQWKALQVKKQTGAADPTFCSQRAQQMEFLFKNELARSNHDEYPGVVGLDNLSEGIKDIHDIYSVTVNRFKVIRPKARHFYTKEGMGKALKSGRVPTGTQFLDEAGTYMDKYGIVRNGDGPYWPVECMPLFPTPRFRWWTDLDSEPLSDQLPVNNRTVETQNTAYRGKWRGTQVAYDSERSPREAQQMPVPEGCCPTLGFESRFECGNLRQARRVGNFEYELVLKTDLYTIRHTQWYYFRVTNAVPGVTYKFIIVNLLKRDSLYNHGMRPLVYSDKEAQDKHKGWCRTGHHISYSRNVTNHNSPLLQRGVGYYMLEWQMEFPNADDTYYLAHCYPYSFTDLKEDLEVLLNNEERSQVTKREVLCESRAGNSCFLLTVTNFNVQEEKKAVVVTARVHPGESQASWMMKGLLEFITGPDPVAKELRNRFVFKIVPMINPDGVIVGNYRCSLAGKDLNRNYRHPWKEKFPTVWHVKKMVEELSQSYEVSLYCDLHGHSRKPNVFMYGNNTSAEGDPSAYSLARAFLDERLFPWLMSVRSPEKFHFKSCKFSIRKCKEATGRVVMWRQMRIYNSFTLEATFSGTALDKTKGRHFNILDFMEMGKILAEVVMDYQKVQEDEVKRTKAIKELTKVVTEQILTARGLLNPESSLPEDDKTLASQKTSDQWTEALLTYLNTPRSELLSVKNTGQEDGFGEGTQAQNIYSKGDAKQMLEQLTKGQSMDACFSVLAQLDIASTMDESDSSDSDSESDAEMKPPETKSKKKKRRSKKQRDRDAAKRQVINGEKKTTEDQRNKTLSALPVLGAISKPPGNSPAAVQAVEGSEGGGINQALNDKLNKGRAVSGFVSKYEGRHNNGLPCFTEERSLERAAKKMAENRQKYEAQKDLSVYFVDEDGMHSIFEDDLSLRLGDLGVVRPLSSAGVNARVGYTHAARYLKPQYPALYNLQETSQSFFPPTSGNGALSNPGYRQNSYNFDASSTDSSGSMEDMIKSSAASNSKSTQVSNIPLSSKRTPYQQLEPLDSRGLMDSSPMAKLSYISNSLRPGRTSATAAPSNLTPLPHHSRLSTPESLSSALSTTQIPVSGLRSRHSEPKLSSVGMLKQIRESLHEDSDCSNKEVDDVQAGRTGQTTERLNNNALASAIKNRADFREPSSHVVNNHFKSRSIEQMINHLSQNLNVSPITVSKSSNINRTDSQNKMELPTQSTRPTVLSSAATDRRSTVPNLPATVTVKRDEKRSLLE